MSSGCENSRGEWLMPPTLGTKIIPTGPSRAMSCASCPAPEGINFEDVEKNLILQAMDQTDYNITKAAKLLGLTFRTLQYRLEKFGIKRSDGKDEKEEETGE